MTKQQNEDMVDQVKKEAAATGRTLEDKTKNAYNTARDELNRGAGRTEKWAKDTYQEVKETLTDTE